MTSRTFEQLGLVRFSDLQPIAVQWLWQNYLPLGKLSILEGPPGRGKSTLIADLAARTSTGAPMPLESVSHLSAKGVLLLSAEDDAGGTQMARLQAAGADLSMISTHGEAFPLDEALNWLEESIDAVGAGLVVVDPLTAFLGPSIDVNRDHSIRKFLTPLAAIAQRRNVAMLLVRHLNKTKGRSALDRGAGSIGLTGAARSVLLLEADPDEDDLLVLARTKGNLSARPPSLNLRMVEESRGIPRVEWTGATAYLADDLVGVAGRGHRQGTRSSKLDDASEFLRQLLAEGPMLAKDVLNHAKINGIAKKTLERAKDSIGIQARFRRQLDTRYWEWYLADVQDAQTSESKLDPTLAAYGTTESVRSPSTMLAIYGAR